jgi:hypothetical protein
MGLFGCFPIIHLAVGIAAVTGAMDNGSGPPPAFGWIFICIAVVMMAFAWSLAIAIVVAGRKLAAHSAYMYCLVVAGIECIFTPIGTVLGVFTIIVLMRPSVKELFGVPVNGGQVSQSGSVP